MRRKHPLFPWNPHLFHGRLDIGCQTLDVRRSLDAGPETARVFFVGKESEAAKFQTHQLIGPHASERASNGDQFRFRNFADEFERYVEILGPYPASLRRNLA